MCKCVGPGQCWTIALLASPGPRSMMDRPGKLTKINYYTQACPDCLLYQFPLKPQYRISSPKFQLCCTVCIYLSSVGVVRSWWHCLKLQHGKLLKWMQLSVSLYHEENYLDNFATRDYTIDTTLNWNGFINSLTICEAFLYESYTTDWVSYPTILVFCWLMKICLRVTFHLLQFHVESCTGSGVQLAPASVWR